MKKNLYIGVDVGGTKISAGLVDARGRLLAEDKISTPQKAKPIKIVSLIKDLIHEVIKSEDIKSKDIKGIGVGVPGIVDIDQNKILITPNINLTGISLGQELKKTFKANVSVGNDVNLGLLGEHWLGAAQNTKNVIGIFPGTGIGGSIIIDGKLILGATGAAGEIGHMLMDPAGPKCSCGNTGCLEALASRWAIERDIRQAIRKSEKTVLKELTKDLNQIKSRFLKEALKRKDPLVTRVIKKVSLTLAQACISLRHILNPELIVLGGGVIKACGFFMLPLIVKTFEADPFFKKMDHCRIVQSQLGDEAVILGAVALVKK